MGDATEEPWVEETLTSPGVSGLLDDYTRYADLNLVDPDPDLYAPAVVIVQTPIAQNVQGVRERVWDLTFFGIIHVIPRTKDVGSIVSPVTFPVEIWNADDVAHVGTAVVVTPLLSGVSVASGPTLPSTWAPFSSQSSTILVDNEGDPIIDAFVTWTFPGFSGTDCHVIGVRLTVYALEPEWDAGMTERLHWLTDILTASDLTEQRVALRANPDRSLEYSGVTITPEQASEISIRLHNGGQGMFTVPYWPDRVAPTADVAAGVSTILVDTTGRAFAVDGLVILWRDARTWEAAKITAVAAGSITIASLTGFAWPKASSLVIPLLAMRLAAPAKLSRPSPTVLEVQAEFTTEPV